jgi:hypothetical protein
VSVAIARKLGPLITTIVVIGRSGPAFAAEIGTMRVTEELDALQTMALDPVAFLVVPKFLAMAVMLPCLAIWADPMGVLGGSLFGMVGGGLTFVGYMLATRDVLFLRDITSGVIKSLVFGMVIAAVGCHEGFATGSGAEEVGRSTTSGRGNLHSADYPDRPDLYRVVLPGTRGTLKVWRPPAPRIRLSRHAICALGMRILRFCTGCFEVRRCETLVVMGGSGSGKSTTLRTLAGGNSESAARPDRTSFGAL